MQGSQPQVRLARLAGRPGKQSAAVIFGFFVFPALYAQDEAELAQQLANPISSLISVPFQGNYDENFGPNDQGSILRINVQPVVPFSLNEDWNLISRTILPIVDQEDVPSPGVSEFGLGDTVQSLFFSPAAPTSGGWIWGAGPVFLLPTATDDVLGARNGVSARQGSSSGSLDRGPMGRLLTTSSRSRETPPERI